MNSKLTDSQHDVLGIGNAMVDVVSHTDDLFLEQNGLIRGAMTLIDAERSESLYRQMESRVQCSGGSAANTMVGLAALGASARYIGKVADDPLGRVFADDLSAAGVDFAVDAAKAGPSTGRCMVFVTPDAQRTMQTYLGASATLAPEDIDPQAVQSARVVYLEGYLYDPPPAQEAFQKAATLAHSAGRKVALSLSDPFCVDRHRADFLDLIVRHVDIVFANEEEVVALFQAASPDEALGELRSRCEQAAVTRGERGSVVLSAKEFVEVDAFLLGDVVDTTGAGDLYASGFLFGLTRGQDLATCGRLGSLAAGEIINHFGARPACSLKDLVAGEDAKIR